jgi:trans-aconitate methyltransferase
MEKEIVDYVSTDAYAEACRNASDNNLDSLLFSLSYANISALKFNSILDIGSQEGQFASLVSTRSSVADVSCIDISSVTVDNGRKRFPEFDWHCCDFNEFDSNRSYDAITSLNWFFYYSKVERKKALLKIRNLLTKNGSFMLSFGDINFEKRHNITYEQVVAEVAQVMDIASVVRLKEAIPYNKEAHISHSYLGRWYTIIVAKK